MADSSGDILNDESTVNRGPPMASSSIDTEYQPLLSSSTTNKEIDNFFGITSNGATQSESLRKLNVCLNYHRNHDDDYNEMDDDSSDAGIARFSEIDERIDVFNREHNEHAISNFDTIVHLLKGNLGSGILAMPNAIMNSGLLVGNVGLVIMACICVHCMHLLVKCSHELAHRTNKPFLSYADVTEKAFSTATSLAVRRLALPARRCIEVFLCLTQLGFCCVYFVFVSQNIKMVMDHHFGLLDYHSYMLIILVPMLFLASIRNLKYLTPISVFANFLQFFSLILIFFYLLQDLPYTWDRKLFASWSQLPLYFGTAIYAFEGIGVVLPLENQMRYPRDMKGWNGVLNTSMVIVSCLYIAVGFFGYLKYGDSVSGSVTLNLPIDESLSQIIIISISVSIFFTYGLQFHVPVLIILPFINRKIPEHHHLMAEYILRLCLVLLTFFLAAAIPCLDLFISLVGAMSSSTLALMAPPVIDIVTFWSSSRHGTSSRGSHLAKNILIFAVGFIGFITGSYASIKHITNYFLNESI